MVKTKRTMPVDAQFVVVGGMRPSEGQMDTAAKTRLIAAAALLTTILLSGYMVAVG